MDNQTPVGSEAEPRLADPAVSISGNDRYLAAYLAAYLRLFAIEQLGRRHTPRRAPEGHVEAFGDEPFANILHGFGAAIERLRDARIRPSRTVHVGLQKGT